MKALVILLTILAGVWLVKRSMKRRQDAAAPQRAGAPRQLPMLACAHCGIHIPQAEALMLGSEAYCCAEHQRLGPA